MIEVFKQRPRFSDNMSYFSKTYQHEASLLMSKSNLLFNIMNFQTPVFSGHGVSGIYFVYISFYIVSDDFDKTSLSENTGVLSTIPLEIESMTRNNEMYSELGSSHGLSYFIRFNRNPVPPQANFADQFQSVASNNLPRYPLDFQVQLSVFLVQYWDTLHQQIKTVHDSWRNLEVEDFVNKHVEEIDRTKDDDDERKISEEKFNGLKFEISLTEHARLMSIEV